MISLRIRSPNGTAACSLRQDATLFDLGVKIEEIAAIAAGQQELRTGFPPKPIAAGAAPETSLSSLGIRSGDSIVVARSTSTKTTASLAKPEPRASQNAPMPSAASFKSDEVAHHSTGPTSSAQTNSPQFVEADGGYVVLRVVPDDNSCLFTAVSLVLNPYSPPDPAALRQIVGDAIKADSVTYNEVLLGRPATDYVETILSPKSWGGAIELAILSDHYQAEIMSFDVQTGRVDKFGEGSGYQNCVLIVYSGIHYDALTFSFAPPTATLFPPDLSFDTTIFANPVDPSIFAAATRLVETLRKSHSYTDTATFSLRCEVCREAIKGEKEARQHASRTGHQSFGEYDG
ncbi:hypothetical protein JCM3766R1_006105 [Sporobolomyces carnicolor]